MNSAFARATANITKFGASVWRSAKKMMVAFSDKASGFTSTAMIASSGLMTLASVSGDANGAMAQFAEKAFLATTALEGMIIAGQLMGGGGKGVAGMFKGAKMGLAQKASAAPVKGIAARGAAGAAAAKGAAGLGMMGKGTAALGAALGGVGLAVGAGLVGVAGAVALGVYLHRKKMAKIKAEAESIYKDNRGLAEELGMELQTPKANLELDVFNSKMKELSKKARKAGKDLDAVGTKLDQEGRNKVAEENQDFIDRLEGEGGDESKSSMEGFYKSLRLQGYNNRDAVRILEVIAERAGKTAEYAEIQSKLSGSVEGNTMEDAAWSVSKQMEESLLGTARQKNAEWTLAKQQDINANANRLEASGYGTQPRPQVEKTDADYYLDPTDIDEYKAGLNTLLDAVKDGNSAAAGALNQQLDAIQSDYETYQGASGGGTEELENLRNDLRHQMEEGASQVFNIPVDSIKKASLSNSELSMLTSISTAGPDAIAQFTAEFIANGGNLAAAIRTVGGNITSALLEQANDTRLKAQQTSLTGFLNSKKMFGGVKSGLNKELSGEESALKDAQSALASEQENAENVQAAGEANVKPYQDEVDAAQKAADAVNEYWDDKIEAAEEAAEAQQEAIDKTIEGYEDEKEAIDESIEKINEKKEKINDELQDYKDAVDKRQKIDEHYANQRKNVGSLVSAISSGDAGAVIKATQDYSSEEARFSADQAMQRREDIAGGKVDDLDRKIENKEDRKEEIDELIEKENEKKEAINESTEAIREQADAAKKAAGEKVEAANKELAAQQELAQNANESAQAAVEGKQSEVDRRQKNIANIQGEIKNIDEPYC